MTDLFGAYVRGRREARRRNDRAFSVRQVANRIGIEPSYLSKIERGEQRPPSEATIVKLAEDLDNMKLLVASENPILSQAASHFFEKRHGKRFRPTIVMLLAQALPNAHKDSSEVVFERQTRLGQVTEMIHVASLIHDDVLDDADTRRGGDAIHKMYSNKVAVLSGDYLLARASVLLAKLGHMDVVQVMARALDSLVSGEIMQIKANGAADKKSSEDKNELSEPMNGKRSFLDRAKAADLRNRWGFQQLEKNPESLALANAHIRVPILPTEN